MIYYKVTRADILKTSTTKWSKVLQLKYADRDEDSAGYSHCTIITKEFYAFLKDLKPKVLYNRITIEEANEVIYQKVAELTTKYPKYFPSHMELGYYSKRMLCEKYINGEVTINDNYTVNTMIADRLALEEKVKEIETKRRLLVEAEELCKQEKLAEAEARRIPVEVGMLFHNKAGVVRAYLHQYPKGTKLYAITNEIGNAVKLERGRHTQGNLCWRVNEIFIEGGLAYQDDLVITGEQDAN